MIANQRRNAVEEGHPGFPSLVLSVEFVLQALATCLTGTLIHHAAVRKGFNKVAVNMRVKSKASAEQLTEPALYSPVYDMVSGSLPVEFTLTTY